MGDERPRLRDIDHDAPDGLATNGVFDRGSVGTDGRSAGDPHHTGPRADGDALPEADG